MLDKILNSRYNIIENLGRGGFGETYLAQDQWLEGDNRCVVKQLKPNIINKFSLRLFEQEAQVLFKLGRHDQIPQLLAHFQQEQEFYLVQEFIEGHDLTQEIKAGHCWSETQVMKLLWEILEVLEFVHDNNVIHRDIKPANIMRRKDGKIVLIDFGGVKQLTKTTSTVTTHVVGTPGYMPIEQTENQAKLCSDIYAVGMLAIEALTGEDPIDIPTDSKTFQPIWRDKAQVSEKLADVLDKMVRFNFAERYQSATEALDALENISYTALDWCKQGEKLYELRRYQQALAAFDKAIEIQQNYPEAWAGRGWALGDLGRYDQALAACEQAIQLKSDYHKAWTGRAWVLLSLGKHDEALINYDRAIELKSDDYHAWTGRAWALMEFKRYDEALISCNQAIELQQNYPEAWAGRGWALLSLGRYDEALAACEQAIEIQQDFPDAWYHRALVLEKLEDYEQALASYDQAIQIQQDFPDAWYHRALVLEKLEDYEQALASYDQVIKMLPNYYEAWYNRGLVLNNLSWYKETLASFDKVIEIKQDNPEVWYHRGWVLNNLRRYRQATKSYNQALSINPGYQLAKEERQLIQKRLITKFCNSLFLILFYFILFTPFNILFTRLTTTVTAFYLTCVMIQESSIDKKYRADDEKPG